VIKYYKDLVQGTDEWHAARCGLLTASEMKLIVTPTLKPASNEKERAHMYELCAQRITGYVEPRYIGDDMLRGHADEIEARRLYSEHHAEVTEMGFITNDKWGFKIGYSPDGLVGKTGAIECKSRCQKYQLQTLLENVASDKAETIPSDFVIQVQTSMLVAELEWIDFVSYCGGLPMAVIRVRPNPAVQQAIITAASEFERRAEAHIATYRKEIETNSKLLKTERRIEQEMYMGASV